jgi:hypothetical protein
MLASRLSGNNAMRRSRPMESQHRPVPHARREGLVVQELPDELLVYDLERHRSHCLNRAAALVWRHCDGKTTVHEMTVMLRQEFAQPFDEDLVWLALNRLQRARLLQTPIELPEAGSLSSRRALMRRMAMVGGAALVASIPVPSARAAAASAGVIGAPCTKNNECISNHCCNLGNGQVICTVNCGSECIGGCNH